MAYLVLVRIDSAGERPVLLRDGEGLFWTADEAQWRLIGETSDYAVAVGWLSREHARCGQADAAQAQP